MRRRLAVSVAVALAGAAVAAVAFALLRPSSAAAPGAPAATPGALVSPAKRQSLPAVSEDVLNPPPERLDLASLRGAPAFIDVWASWCLSCEEEAPVIARLAREFRGCVRFIGIDVQDSRGAGRSFVRRHGLAFPHLFDPDGSVAAKLAVYGIPTMLLVDREGRIAGTLVGRQAETKLRRTLRALATEP